MKRGDTASDAKGKGDRLKCRLADQIGNSKRRRKEARRNDTVAG